MSSGNIRTLRLNHGPDVREGVAFEYIISPRALQAADATDQQIIPILAFPPAYFFRLRDLTPLQHGFSPWSFRSLAS